MKRKLTVTQRAVRYAERLSVAYRFNSRYRGSADYVAGIRLGLRIGFMDGVESARRTTRAQKRRPAQSRAQLT